MKLLLETILIITISLVIILWLSGCFFARVDYEVDGTRVSGTIWTIGKSYYVEPNSLISESDKIKLIYPPIGLETE